MAFGRLPYQEFERYGQYAQDTFKDDARVNICISKKNLESIHKRALGDGIPYQTLMVGMSHKYLNGRLIERSSYPHVHT